MSISFIKDFQKFVYPHSVALLKFVWERLEFETEIEFDQWK